VDINRARADEVASETGSRASVDALELLGQVDAVTVAVPTAEHALVAIPFLEAGLPVLVEKPIAASLAEADAMIRVASKRGVTLAVGHSERYNPAVTVAMPLVVEPRFVEVHRLAAFPARGLDVDVVFDVMIHDIDVLLAIVQEEPLSIEAVGVPVLTDRIDIANTRLRFGDGCIANLTASRISRDRVRKLRFFQRHALVTVDCLTQQVEAFRVTRSPGQEPVIEGGNIPVPDGEPLELELRDFVSTIRTGGTPRVDGIAGRRALAVAEKIAAAMLGRNDQLRPPDRVA
jgi:predicted dehydrogenase